MGRAVLGGVIGSGSSKFVVVGSGVHVGIKLIILNDEILNYCNHPYLETG